MPSPAPPKLGREGFRRLGGQFGGMIDAQDSGAGRFGRGFADRGLQHHRRRRQDVSAVGHAVTNTANDAK